MKRPTLRRRLNRVLLGWFLLFVAASGIVLVLSSSGLRHDVLEERLLLARTIAHSLESTVSGARQDLGQLALDVPLEGPSSARELRAFRFQSPFRDGIYILDESARMLVSDPPNLVPLPLSALGDREAVTTLIRKEGEDSSPVVAVVHPFERGGSRFVLVSEMVPGASVLSTFVRGLSADPGMHIAVIDADGVIIACQEPRLLLRTFAAAPELGDGMRNHRALASEELRCELCDAASSAVLTVMSPLRMAPWGVVIQEHQSKAFAAVDTTRRGMLIAGGLLAATALLLSRALERSIVSPIRQLSEQASTIRSGDLSTPVVVSGDEEVERLGRTLEEARARLASTLGELNALNEDLERQVEERTEVIVAKYRDLQLLHALAQLPAGEREPVEIARRALRLLMEHSGIPAARIVVHPLDGEPEAITEPRDAPLPDALVPSRGDRTEDGKGTSPVAWHRREILHRDRLQAELFHPALAGPDEQVMEAFQHQLAVAIHHASLWKRMIAQDEQRRVLVRRLLRAAEDERTRLARELHDEIAQLLTVIQLSLEEMGSETPQVRKAMGLLVTTQTEIHRIIHDLRPSVLDDLGLAAAMKSYAREHLTRNGVNASLEIEQGLAARPEIDIATFRIYQELVTNVLRHAGAGNVSVELYESDGKLVLVVEDDGAGFDVGGKTKGVGITGMRERAALVGGRIRFDSEPGMGTHVSVEIPI